MSAIPSPLSSCLKLTRLFVQHIFGGLSPYVDPTHEFVESSFGYNKDGPYYRQRCEILVDTEIYNRFWQRSYKFGPGVYLEFAQVVTIMLDDCHRDSM